MYIYDCQVYHVDSVESEKDKFKFGLGKPKFILFYFIFC